MAVHRVQIFALYLSMCDTLFSIAIPVRIVCVCVCANVRSSRRFLINILSTNQPASQPANNLCVYSLKKASNSTHGIHHRAQQEVHHPFEYLENNPNIAWLKITLAIQWSKSEAHFSMQIHHNIWLQYLRCWFIVCCCLLVGWSVGLSIVQCHCYRTDERCLTWIGNPSNFGIYFCLFFLSPSLSLFKWKMMNSLKWPKNAYTFLK